MSLAGAATETFPSVSALHLVRTFGLIHDNHPVPADAARGKIPLLTVGRTKHALPYGIQMNRAYPLRGAVVSRRSRSFESERAMLVGFGAFTCSFVCAVGGDGFGAMFATSNGFSALALTPSPRCNCPEKATESFGLTAGLPFSIAHSSTLSPTRL
jgi:hypothetical protein